MGCVDAIKYLWRRLAMMVIKPRAVEGSKPREGAT